MRKKSEGERERRKKTEQEILSSYAAASSRTNEQTREKTDK